MAASRALAVTPNQFATFGELLKFLRRRAGLTQRDLSIAVGYSPSQISRLEQNERPPDAASLAACFVPALQLEPEWAARLLELAAISRAVDQPPETEPFPRTAPRHNLPSHLDPFIGRDQELAEIAALIEQPLNRLITLVGPGGIGKTRLAIEAARHHAPVFADGVCFVPLAAVTAAEVVITQLASALGIDGLSASDPRRQLLRFLRAKEL